MINPLQTLLLGHFGAFVLVLARVGGLVATAPLLSSRASPPQFRAALAVAAALLATPLVAATTTSDPTNLALFSRDLINETLVGVLLGLGVSILLQGVQLTGQMVSQLGGAALADVFDPSFDESVPIYGQLLYFLTLAMFVLIGGHRLATEALLDTFAWLPPGRALVDQSFVELLTTIMGQSFHLGMRAAAPAMAALLLATLVLGLIGRTLPQINVLAVGFGVNAITTMAILVLSIGAIAWGFPDQAVAVLETTREVISRAANPAP